MLGGRQAEGMGERLGQRERLLTPLHGLGGIAQAPQHVRPHRQASYSRRRALTERQGALGCRVDGGAALRQVRPGSGVMAQVVQGGPEGVLGQEAGHRVGLALRQLRQLFPHLLCRA